MRRDRCSRSDATNRSKIAVTASRDTGSITGFPGGEDMDRKEAMFLDCEVFLPAATENVITSENADLLRCKVLCEGANGPTTALADRILEEKGIFVIPDILANAGGVTVSYFEWVQDRQGFFWNEQLVNERLNDRLQLAGVVLCLYESGTRLAAEVAGDVEQFFREARRGGRAWANVRLFETRIRRNIRLAEAPSFGQSIFGYAANSPGAEDYRALGGELLAYYAGRAILEATSSPAALAAA